MSAETQEKDRFWIYVGLLAASLITVLIMVKLSENEKFAPIKEQLQEEAEQMNIRVIGGDG